MRNIDKSNLCVSQHIDIYNKLFLNKLITQFFLSIIIAWLLYYRLPRMLLCDKKNFSAERKPDQVSNKGKYWYRNMSLHTKTLYQLYFTHRSGLQTTENYGTYFARTAYRRSPNAARGSPTLSSGFSRLCSTSSCWWSGQVALSSPEVVFKFQHLSLVTTTEDFQM